MCRYGAGVQLQPQDKNHTLAAYLNWIPVRELSLIENDLSNSYLHYSKDGTKLYYSKYIGKKLIH